MMKTTAMNSIQKQIKDGPLLDYVIITLGLSLWAAYLMAEGDGAYTILIKALVVFTIIFLWGVMVYTFMQTPLNLGTDIFAAAITFIAQINIILTLKLDIHSFVITTEVILLNIFISCIVAIAMVEVQYIKGTHNNGKQKTF